MTDAEYLLAQLLHSACLRSDWIEAHRLADLLLASLKGRKL